MVSCAMHILDEDMAANSEVSELFYGFKCHGKGFAIEGYVLFPYANDETEVGRLLPGLNFVPFDNDNDSVYTSRFVCCSFIFTKWGVAVDETLITFEVEWHYQEAQQEHNNDQQFEFAQ